MKKRIILTSTILLASLALPELWVIQAQIGKTLKVNIMPKTEDKKEHTFL